jgi:hypothetical protein
MKMASSVPGEGAAVEYSVSSWVFQVVRSSPRCTWVSWLKRATQLWWPQEEGMRAEEPVGRDKLGESCESGVDLGSWGEVTVS